MLHIFDCINIIYLFFVNNFLIFLLCPQLVVKTKYIDTFIKLFLTFLLYSLVSELNIRQLKRVKYIWSHFVFTESYREYFTTPYFVFIRDTLSYVVLLGLHVAFCLESSTIPFSGLEWAILVFFLGRILMESRQFLDVKVRPRRLAATKDFRGSKYQICSEMEEEIESSPTRGTPFLQRCKKYLR